MTRASRRQRRLGRKRSLAPARPARVGIVRFSGDTGVTACHGNAAFPCASKIHAWIEGHKLPRDMLPAFGRRQHAPDRPRAPFIRTLRLSARSCTSQPRPCPRIRPVEQYAYHAETAAAAPICCHDAGQSVPQAPACVASRVSSGAVDEERQFVTRCGARAGTRVAISGIQPAVIGVVGSRIGRHGRTKDYEVMIATVYHFRRCAYSRARGGFS